MRLVGAILVVGGCARRGSTAMPVSCCLTLMVGAGDPVDPAVGGVDTSPEAFDDFFDVRDALEVGV